MTKGKKRPVLVLPSFVIGNGKVTELDRILRDKNTQRGYSRLLKKMDANPENVAQALRKATWKGKNLDDILSELD